MKRIFTAAAVAALLLGNVLTAQAAYPAPGSGSTNIYVQNIGSTPEGSTVSLEFTAGETGGLAGSYPVGTLVPKGGAIVTPSDFAAVVGTGSWAGSVEVQSSDYTAAVVAVVWDNPSKNSYTAGTYKGTDVPDTESYLPLLGVRDDTVASRVTVQNTDTTVTADIAVHLLDRNGVETKVINDTLPASTEKTYDLTLAQYLPNFPLDTSGGYGAAYITSTTLIAAVGSVFYGPRQGRSSEAYAGVSGGDTTLWFPSIFRRHETGKPWNSAVYFVNYNIVTVQNLGDVPTDIQVQFYKHTGALTHEFTTTIGPKAAQSINTAFYGTLGHALYDPMAAALDAASDTNPVQWRGTIKVTSLPAAGQTTAQPVTGVCTYFARNLGIPDCASYAAVYDSQSGDMPLAFPFFVRQRLGSTNVGNLFSTAFLQNLTSNSGTVTLQFFNSETGLPITGEWTLPMDASAGVNVNMLRGTDFPKDDLTLLGNFVGTLWVTPSPGLRVAGVCNIWWDGRLRGAAYSAFPAPAP